jgi:hypothetical protein
MTSSGVIRPAAMTHVRFPLSMRQVGDLLLKEVFQKGPS